MILKFLQGFVQILVAVFFMVSTAHSEEVDIDINNAFLLGIVPQQSAKEIQSLWNPLINYIKQQTNYPIALHGSADIPTFENKLFSGKFDFVYVNPRLYIDANRHVGYIPLVREKDKKLKAVIVVAKDSKYKTLSDLAGAHLVTPKDAFAASALTILSLHAKNISFVNSYVKTHVHGYSLVANGSVDAAGGIVRTFESLNPDLKNKLRVLWESQEVSPHAFIVHPRVNTKVKERILAAILSFNDTPEGKAFYEALHMHPFEAAQDSDWDDVRQLMGK